MSSRYEIVRQLGEGAFGVVYLSRRKDNHEMVQKEIKLAALMKNEISKLLEEVEVLEKFRKFPHQNLVEGMGYLHAKDTLCIYMEYCENGSLATEIDRRHSKDEFYDKETILDNTYQIASGLDHMHQHLVIHRDLKPANILITRDGALKLADFGMGALLGSKSSLRASVVGTPLYMAPEIIQEEDLYSFSCDIWSFGTILYELMALKPAFDARNSAASMMKIINGNFSPLDNSHAEPLKYLVALMLVVDPSKRPDSSSIAALKFLVDRKINSSSMGELETLQSKKAMEKERKEKEEKQRQQREEDEQRKRRDDVERQAEREQQLRLREEQLAEKLRQLEVREAEVTKRGQEDENRRAASAARKRDVAKERQDTPPAPAPGNKIKKRALTEQEKNLIKDYSGSKFEEYLNEGDFNKGATVLHFVSKKGHIDVVRALLTRGDNVNAKNDNGWTPLHESSRTGHAGTAEVLIKAGATVNAKDNDGETPLHRASYYDVV